MILPQQKSFQFTPAATLEQQDEIINDWIKEMAKKKKHVSPTAPSIIQLANGNVRITYLYAEEK